MAIKSKTRKNRKYKRGGLQPVQSTQSLTLKNQPQSKIVCAGSDIPCRVLDTQYTGKLNQTWDTCINMNGINNHILYLTPNNVIIKSIETAQIPEFNIITNKNKVPTACKIMIEDKYVSCFLFICGNWYAIMRLLGKTINTEYFARTEKNRAFFKLSGITVDIDLNNPNNGSGLITIPRNLYTNVKKTHILSTSSSPVIQLTPNSFTNINKQSIVNDQKVFNVLQRFRQQKLFANNEKQAVAQDVATGVLQGLFQ